MPNSPLHVELSLCATAHLARFVRMAASNMAMLSSMSVDTVQDVKMAAEEAFIYACSSSADAPLGIAFDATPEEVVMEFSLDAPAFSEPAEDDPASYADLLIGAVCSSYEKLEEPARLRMVVKADL